MIKKERLRTAISSGVRAAVTYPSLIFGPSKLLMEKNSLRLTLSTEYSWSKARAATSGSFFCEQCQRRVSIVVVNRS